MPTYCMATSGCLGYSIQPQNDHSSKKYAKGDLSIIKFLVPLTVPITCPHPHSFLGFHSKNYLYLTGYNVKKAL